MSLKTIKTKKSKSYPQSKSDDVDITQPGIVHIHGEPYIVDGAIAKFIIELLDEIDSYKGQLDALESLTGIHGKS